MAKFRENEYLFMEEVEEITDYDIFQGMYFLSLNWVRKRRDLFPPDIKEGMLKHDLTGAGWFELKFRQGFFISDETELSEMKEFAYIMQRNAALMGALRFARTPEIKEDLLQAGKVGILDFSRLGEDAKKANLAVRQTCDRIYNNFTKIFCRLHAEIGDTIESKGIEKFHVSTYSEPERLASENKEEAHYATVSLDKFEELGPVLNSYWEKGYKLIYMTDCVRKDYRDGTGDFSSLYTLVFEMRGDFSHA